MEKVSVVITCYNYGRYVAEAIESVLHQTYGPHEVIIINDGSTDNSEEVIKRFLSDKRVKYIYQNNCGQAKAKNRGISEATGDFIAFLDADDIWEIDKLEQQMPLFNDKEVGVAYSKFIQINDKGEEVKKFKPLKCYRGYISSKLYIDNFICFPSAVIRNKCLLNMGVFDESLEMGIDWGLWLRLSTCYKFNYIGKKLVRYRVGHIGQMSINIERRLFFADKLMREFIEKYPTSVTWLDKRLAISQTYRTKGDYLQDKHTLLALKFNILSLTYNPFQVRPFLRIVKCIYLAIKVK